MGRCGELGAREPLDEIAIRGHQGGQRRGIKGALREGMVRAIVGMITCVTSAQRSRWTKLRAAGLSSRASSAWELIEIRSSTSPAESPEKAGVF